MRLATVSVLLLSLLACVDDVGEGQVKAEVAEVPENSDLAKARERATKAAETAVDTTYKVDTATTRIEALGAKVTATHPIVFPDFSGKVGLTDGKVTAVSFEVTMATLEADHPKLTTHLKDADFFDVPNHPTSTFRATEITEGSDAEGYTHTVTGDFTIRGNTKRITFPATVEVTDGQVVADTVFVIDRQDFGITYPGRKDDLIQDNVKMTLHIVAKAAGDK